MALDAYSTKGSNIFVLDLQTNVTSRLSSGERNDDDPVWSQDSRRIVYVDHGFGPYIDEPVRLMEFTLGERAPTKILEEMNTWVIPNDWSPDGRFLLLSRNNRSLSTLTIASRQKGVTLLEVDAKSIVDEAHLCRTAAGSHIR